MENSAISRLEDFKAKLLAWDCSRETEHRAKLRTFLNQNMQAVRREVIEAGCYATVTIGPPPAVGGLVLQDQDPFGLLFDPPYRLSLVSTVVDMIDRTIGVLSEHADHPRMSATNARVTTETEKGYAFVAMAMDPDDNKLEDVLDAIKEAARRCGLQAERVDEPQFNERITDRILESIQKAEYVIVDLSRSKPNVLFEAGYAHGIGKIPIYVAEQGTPPEFDLKDYPVIFYSNMKQLKDRLERRLRAISERS